MALNITPIDVTLSAIASDITTSNIVYKAQSLNVVPILEVGIDFDVIELDNIARCEGGIIAM